MKLIYPACFYKDEESDAYSVEVPDLPGCASGGNNLTEAILMGIDAASGWILGELEDGQPVPMPSPLHEIKPEEGGFVSLLVLDIDDYAKKYGSGTVHRDIAIPAWLNTFAESQHINFSQLMQETLMEKHRQQYV